MSSLPGAVLCMRGWEGGRGREGERDGGREGGREGRRERRNEGGREGGRDGGKDRGKGRLSISCFLHAHFKSGDNNQ